MTQEEKSLLLQDLCARVPYGVIVQYKGHNTIIKNKLLTGSDLDCNMEYYKPYLRPMSSMTEEEKKELGRISCEGNIEHKYGIFYRSQDYLNSIHVDYRGLIPKGLALEAPEDMYNIKEK